MRKSAGLARGGARSPLYPSPARRFAGRNGAMPSRASSSARSFISSPAWPLTQRQSISWRSLRLVEAPPEVVVLDRLLVGGAPAVALPVGEPAGDAVAHILRVGVQLDAARALQRLQRRDRGHQLHAVVGGGRLAAAQLLLAARRSVRIAPQPPGPGLPEQAPSVQISTSRRHARKP